MELDLHALAVMGIEQSLQKGEISYVDHGFCWYCQTEKPVYEASPNYPVQPPRCFECFEKEIVNIFNDDARLEALLDTLMSRLEEDDQ